MEREKHNNPCELNVDTKSIVLLREIEDEYIIRSENQRVLIRDSIVQHHVRENKKFIEEEIKKINDERNAIISDTITKKEDSKKQIKILDQQHSLLTENINLLETSINEKEEYRKLILDEIEELKVLLKKEEAVMGEKLEKFRSFIKDKADNLLKLEFIEQDEYDDILMLKNKEIEDEIFIDFHQILNGDFAAAISHIQAYLFKNDIVYPRYIIDIIPKSRTCP